MNYHQNNLKGAEYLLLGLKLMWRPGLRRYVIIPITLNAIFFCSLLILSAYFFNSFVDWIELKTASWGAWLEWLAWVVWLILSLGIAMVMSHIFAIALTALASPFNGLLAEHARLELTGIIDSTTTSFVDTLKDLPRSFKREWHKLKYFLPRAGILLVLFLFPVINLLAPILWAGFGAWMLAIEYLDYPFDNDKIEFIDMRRQLTLKGINTISFGGLTMLLFTIPILNWILMPAAVIGATAFYIEQILKQPLKY